MSTLIGNTAGVAAAKDPGQYVNGVSLYPTTAYPTLGSGDRLPILSEGIKNIPTRLESKAFIGEAMPDNSEIQNIRVGGSLKCEVYYDGALPELIMCALGFENPNLAAANGSPQSLGGGAYRHVFEIDQFIGRQGYLLGEERVVNSSWYLGDKKVRSFTMGIDKTVLVERIRAAMINQMTLNATPESVDIDFDIIGYQREVVPYTPSSWTLPTIKKRAIFTGMQGNVYLGTLSTGQGFDWQALTKISQLSIMINNNLKKDDQTTGQGNYIEEPLRNDFANIEVGFKFARHEIATILDQLDLDATMKMSVAFVGSQIGTSGQYYTLKFYFPCLRFLPADDSLGNTGIIAPDYKLKAYQPTGNYMGLNGFVGGVKLLKGLKYETVTPLYTGSAMFVELINTNSSNYLTYF